MTTHRYLSGHAVSAGLYERAVRALPGGNSRTTIFRAPYPPYAACGVGCRVFDEDGEARLDFLNNYTSLIHGHAHPAVVERLTGVLRKGLSFSFPTRLEVELAERLIDQLPGAERVRFTNSGTEAVMLAIRVARAATGRSRIAKFEGCYHGGYDDVTISEQAALADLGPSEQPTSVAGSGIDERRARNVLVLPYNADAALDLIEADVDELAAVIVDPAPNRIGLPVGRADFMAELRELTRRRGIALIFDEVITLRVGRGGMQSRLGITPDLTTLGKIIGGGLPVGAVTGGAAIMDLLDPKRGDGVPHGGTFNANPMTMAAGIATLDLLDDAAYDQLAALTRELAEGLEEAFRGAGMPCRVHTLGSVFQVHLREDPITDYRSFLGNPEARTAMAQLAAAMLRRGVVLAPNGLGCVSTPMTSAEIGHFVDTATSATGEVEALAAERA